ncbi:glucuronate isomerase [Spirochaeta thermophila]|uniref:Uronate isomerase n=1 Tax=Winmispira thermophila (strain ATCC 49972 / DSM 6192 / RI 19.B1) TaxID=665571 RepID=E0RQ48_WINT6|nr:glucuronate isomerase [Spirochaeta thermophila]ADN01432.1 uronate isomerase [Spirochaeta thermophila DSM 6192]
MRAFMDENFMLQGEVARELYHETAASLPIYDYHTHLPPEAILEDRIFEDLGEVWLGGDHYKWRAMRSFGIPEDLVTGSASFKEKYLAWARTVPFLVGNPLYHWTHLELKRYFGIEDVLSPQTAERIYQEATSLLRTPEFSVRNLLRKMGVKVVCTTDDPVSDLAPHRALAEEGFEVKVLPTFRPDKALDYGDPGRWNAYIEELAHAAGMRIANLQDYLEALERRVAFFHSVGCRISDHAMVAPVYREAPESTIRAAFVRLREGRALEREDQEALYTHTMRFLGRLYAEREWAMQIHMGALRNNSTRMFQTLGPDTGFDSIADRAIAEPLSRFLDSLDREGRLPRTILYVLNPRDNYVIGTMIGNFQDGSMPGKMQFGSAWWFNDQRDGMEAHLRALANLGVLSTFVGMLTDSRSFLSFPRHEYFRRIFCNLLGGWVEAGEYPYDRETLRTIVEGVCYRNACSYFTIPVE